jgi:hypothetical protein
MKTSSAKAKGRRLQDKVVAALRARFPSLHPDDIKPAVMGECGEDIKLSPAARALVPYAIECKNTERLNIWQAIQQAEANAGEYTPLLVFSRNRSGAYAVVSLEHFIERMGSCWCPRD